MVDEPTEHDDLFPQPQETPPVQEPQSAAVETAAFVPPENAPETLPMMTSMPAQKEIRIVLKETTPLIFTDRAPIPTRNGVAEDTPNCRKKTETLCVKKDFVPLSSDQLPANPTVGTVLRLARETAGYDLDQIHELTRISTNIIAQIEKDKFDGADAVVYLTAYIRTLSAIYRLPEDISKMLLDMHQRNLREKDEISQDLLLKLSSDALVNEEEERRVARIFTVSAVALVLILLLGIWAIIAAVICSESEEEKAKPEIAVQTEAVAPAAAPAVQERFDQKELECLNAEQITDLYTLEMGRNPVIRREWNGSKR